MEDKQSTASPKLQYRLLHTFTGHTDAVAAVKLSRSGLHVLSCSADKSIRLWDVEEKKEVRVFHGHDRGCSDVVWHPSGQYMATASDDHTLRLWDIESGRTLRTLRSHTHNVMCCHFHPCGNLLASGSFDESVRLWDVRTGEAVKSIPAHSDPVTSVNFNVDGTCLVSSSFDGLIRVWETFSGKCVKTLNCGKGGSEWIPPVSSTIYAPNGLYLLLSTLNGRIRVWDPHKTKPIRFFRGHKNQEYCLNSTWAGSEHVVSGSEDNGIYFWGLQGPTMGGGRKPVYTIPGRVSESDAGDGHCDVVLCVDHTAGACPAGARLVTGSMKRDKSIKLWERCKPEGAAITGS